LNAIIQILEQLLAAVPQDLWHSQRFYPFPTPPTGPITLFDACVFQQGASGALGMAWLTCPGHQELLTFPFRISRYSQDGDLIFLPPWSLREATADADFYSNWKQAAQATGRLATIRGGALHSRQFEAQSSFNIINLWTDNKNACTRVETQHLCKIFRVASPKNPYSIEAEILEYLTAQNVFLQHPELTTRYDLHPVNSDGKGIPVAIVTRYIQSNAKLWQELTAKIQHARYPEPMREYSSRVTWFSILETTGKLGRLLAEFHLAMTHSRKNQLLNPETNMGEAKEKWLETLLRQLNERIYHIRNIEPSQGISPQDCNRLADFAHDLFEKIKRTDHLGLLIRTHGHAHLGQVLVSDDGLYLVNYETDSLDDEEYRIQKQSALKDLAAMMVSLQFAWSTTERNESLPVFNEILSPESEYGQHVIRKLEKFSEPQRYAPSLIELENAFTRSYLLTIAEDASGIELLPQKNSDLENLYDFCFLLRILKETVRDLRQLNPRFKTDLKILMDHIDGRLKRPNFEAFFNSPARFSVSPDHEPPYGMDSDFS
jgi:predicted trehalose synthase